MSNPSEGAEGWEDEDEDEDEDEEAPWTPESWAVVVWAKEVKPRGTSEAILFNCKYCSWMDVIRVFNKSAWGDRSI